MPVCTGDLECSQVVTFRVYGGFMIRLRMKAWGLGFKDWGLGC